MFLDSSNPLLTNVTISQNEGSLHGGGMFLYYSNPILTNVTIANNTAYFFLGFELGKGGGIHLDSSNPTLNHVTITDNGAAQYGGGMNLRDSNPILTNVTISHNTADSQGGGIYFYTNNELTYPSNILIANNYSVGHGGGIFLSAGATINLQHATIAGNIVGEGDVFGAGIYSDGGTANLVNSIVYYNRREGDSGINYTMLLTKLAVPPSE
jgi:predicted outer membrane repeat protein